MRIYYGVGTLWSRSLHRSGKVNAHTLVDLMLCSGMFFTHSSASHCGDISINDLMKTLMAWLSKEKGVITSRGKPKNKL